jgi:hypothetical protein
MNPLNYSIIILIISIILLVLFFNGVVTGIVLFSFANFTPNGIIFAPDCGSPDDTGDICFDADNVGGGEILNCLHGGACPAGVSFGATGSETEDVTPDSDPDAGDGGIVASTFVDNTKDTDEDGIIDALDQCVLEAETVNGFLDEDGCPESTQTPTVNEPPQVTVENVLINPPPLTDEFLAPETLSSSASAVNLHEAVDSVIILVIIVIIGLILALAGILKKNLGKKKR